ncbi:putative C-S lyase [Prevotella sp. MSX73]|nr:putative C-S lyase [Prevotella sp. MSX73]
MSTFDFDTVINRRGTNSYKWDIVKEEDVIPLWVADMDFKAAPAILEALKKRVEHGVFGYTLVPDSYYEAIINWFARRHNWQIDRSWIIYTTGVVPAVSCAIKALTLPGEKVLIQTPDYNCFFSSIKNNGCEVAENELVHRGDSYEVDFEDFERQCADEKTTVFLLCTPHNPAGRVWTKEELERMNDICLAHGVRVISDEIHCELVMPGHRFTPFTAISDACRDNSVVLNSPTKAFNIAGLQIANIICADPAMRRRIDRAVNINEVCDVNPFGVVALQAAYNESEEWLDSLNHYIWGNYLALKEFIAKELPRLEVTRLEGTYLAWVDIKATGLTSDEAYGKLMKEGRVYVNSGTMYGRRAGEGYLRINLACPRATLLEGLKRMGGVLRQYLS